MSPMLQASLRRFRQNKLGMLCLVLLGCILSVSMAAEWLANDKPLVVKYDTQYSFPIFKQYPETYFGGVFETEADYKDPVLQALIAQKGWAIWPLVHYAADTPNLNLAEPVPSPPSKENWLGTDDQGRDVFTRILYGLRVSLLFALALTLASALLGIVVGAIQGYFAGWVDLIGQRLLELWSGLPMLFTVMIVVSLLSPNIYWLFVLMLLFSWTRLVAVVRAEFLAARNLEYVWAARSIGVGHMAIIFRHILPNVIHSSLSQLPFMLTANISALTALDFLGYGLPAETASLGELLLQAKNNLNAPWLALSGFLTLSILLTLFILLGEALRDAFNPKYK